MNREARIQAVSVLQSEIREMELTVQYLQGRIDRKRIAIAELMTGMECTEPLPPERRLPATEPRLSLADMCRAVVQKFNGHTFNHDDIKRHLEYEYPGKLKTYQRQTFYGAVRTMQEEGLIAPTEGGFVRAQP